MLLLDPLARPVIAHRGDRAHAPENTLVAFERAVTAGADAIEMDVHATADGHVVVLHDPGVDRTTDGTGLIETLDLARLRELDAGARWSPHADPDIANGARRGAPTPFAGQGHRVPLLEEVLEMFPDTPLLLDLKTDRAAHHVVALLDRFAARNRVMLGAFEHRALTAARAARYRTVASRRELMGLYPFAMARRRARAGLFDAIAIPPRHRGIPVPLGGYVRAIEGPVHVWTINESRIAERYWRLGVRGIVTDDPVTMLAARHRMRAAG